MCGIIAYTGSRPAALVLLDGMRSLEYRGYDSAGIAVQDARGRIRIAKRAGRVNDLAAMVGDAPPEGTFGIGHTRWATHGRVTDVNAHPHIGSDGRVAIVHNGIVENYLELREELVDAGYSFSSDTDSEVISHLIARLVDDGASLEEGLRFTARRLAGASAVVAMSAWEPGKIAGLRLGNAGGIVIGFGEDENLLASDLLALLPYTDRIAYLESGEVCVMKDGAISIMDLAGNAIRRPPDRTSRTFESVQKGPYAHFMAKEIAEQPEAAAAALGGRIDLDAGTVELPGFPLTRQEIGDLRRVVLVGMGTSLHAAMVGAHFIEDLARLPATAENASEFRYRRPALGENDLVVAITQSGETADTLAAMEQAANDGAKLVALVEAEGTQATRLADCTLPIRAGQEIAVASTKTMMSSLVVLAQVALYIAARRGRATDSETRAAVDSLARLPALIGELLDLDAECARLARSVSGREHLLYLGRGPLYPIAMEGALKMKEVAYVHAEGYAAGEMKHGVNALISDAMPTIAIVTEGPLYDKMLSNVNEVKARGGHVTALATRGDRVLASICDEVLTLPASPQLLTPMLALVPLQLLAYHVAIARGNDPDKPRNLAKTVTVE